MFSTKTPLGIIGIAATALLLIRSVADSQSRSDSDAEPSAATDPAMMQMQVRQSGRVTDIRQMEVGVRKTASATAVGLNPLARISVRMQNRVQNRLYNSVDRFYKSQANVLSPYRIASEQGRKNFRQRFGVQL